MSRWRQSLLPWTTGRMQRHRQASSWSPLPARWQFTPDAGVSSTCAVVGYVEPLTCPGTVLGTGAPCPPGPWSCALSRGGWCKSQSRSRPQTSCLRRSGCRCSRLPAGIAGRTSCPNPATRSRSSTVKRMQEAWWRRADQAIGRRKQPSEKARGGHTPPPATISATATHHREHVKRYLPPDAVLEAEVSELGLQHLHHRLHERRRQRSGP